jgi:hypothetical protein
MLKIIKSMDDSEIESVRFKVSKLKYVVQKFGDLLYQEYEIRTDKTRLN